MLPFLHGQACLLSLLGSCGLPVGCRRPWDGLEAGAGGGSRIVFHARDLEAEPRVCSPVSGHLLKPQRRGMKPWQTDTLEKASESGDVALGSRCLPPCGGVGRWPPFTLWTSGFDLRLHPPLSPWSLHKHSWSA